MNTRHFWIFAGLLFVLTSVTDGVAQSKGSRDEQELIAILRSDKPEADKALACKQLSVYGSTKAVPELAKLLSNERLASWARIALEVIPGAEVEEALRKATESLEGRLLVGTINSIGVRRDSGAVELLSGRLRDKDAEVASAAAVALGRIGSDAAGAALLRSLANAPAPVRAAIAEGCVLCAEHFLAKDKAAEAVKLYDAVRNAEVPRQRMLDATRGAILARGKDGVPLLIEQLRSNDKGLFQIGLSTAREFPGGEVDKALSSELERAFPERGALIIAAMADRPQTVDLAGIMKAAGSGPKPVRLAAITALGQVGNASCLSSLLESAVESDAEIAEAAKQSLAALPGRAVDQELVSRLRQREGKTYLVLLELVGRRRIDATDELLEAVNSKPVEVRAAALKSLGSTATAKQLPVLIAEVVSPKDSASSEAAEAALKEAAVRMPDREACAGEIATAMNRASLPKKIVLLDVLAAVGGTKALAAVGAAAKSSDPGLQDAATQKLGEWMTIDAAPVLLDLAKSNSQYAVRALRGYIRIARQFTMSEEQRIEMCRTALEAARRPDERKLVLEVIQRYPSVEMLKLAVRGTQFSDVKEEARAAAKAISAKVRPTEEVRELLSKAGVSN